MNATRAASIRLRAAFDGVVSLGRVQTPTLALVARREEEIRAFKPEPYWLVEADFAADAERLYSGRYLGGKRIDEELAATVVEECRDQRGEITKLEKKEERERSQLLYDLTSLQREANTRFGFSAQAHARRGPEALRAAQGDHLPAHELALALERHDPRDPPHRRAGRQERASTRRARHTSPALKDLPLGRVVNNTKVEDHHAIIPTKSAHDLSKMSADERRSTTWSPGASWRSSTRTPSSSARGSRPPSPSTSSAPAGACCSRRAGARSTGRRSTRPARAEDDSGGDQMLPKLELGEERRRAPRRVAAQGDAAAAAVHRGLAARGDGDGGQGHRGRRSCARR